MNNIITKIELGKRNKNRVNVFIDEEFSFSCSTDLVYYYNLEKGKVVDLDLLKDVVDEDSYIKGKNDALKIIERSYKSEKEIIEKLLNKGYQEKVVDRIISFLKQYSFIDDKKYAQMFIKDKSLSLGRNKIRYMLKKKGIDEGIIEQELNSLKDTFESETALKLARKKFDILRKSEVDVRKIYKKLGDYLVTRGYGFDIVTSTLNQVISLEEYDGNDTGVRNCTNSFDLEHNNTEENLDKLKKLAEKRYALICKLEKDKLKVYKKLSEYLTRRGYNWGDIKKILKEIVEDE